MYLLLTTVEGRHRTGQSIEFSLITVESVISGLDNFLRRFPIRPRRPFFRFASKLSQSLHFLTEILVFVPVEAVVPENSHQLIGLLHGRVVSDPALTLLFWFILQFPQHLSRRFSQGSSHLPKYLSTEPLHIIGIVTVAFHSSGVAVDLCHRAFRRHL